jgi:hypothetical protein
MRKLVSCLLGSLVVIFGLHSSLATADGKTASALESDAVGIDDIAPWVRVPRYIPVYVDGQLVGYIVHYVVVWMNEP